MSRRELTRASPSKRPYNVSITPLSRTAVEPDIVLATISTTARPAPSRRVAGKATPLPESPCTTPAMELNLATEALETTGDELSESNRRVVSWTTARWDAGTDALEVRPLIL